MLGQTLQVTGGARKKATGCMAVPPVPALLQAILRPVHARSSCGIKTAAQCLQAIARAPAKDVASDAPRPRTPTAATSSARVPSLRDDDAQNWRRRWGRVAEIWGAEPKNCCVKVVRLKGKYVRSLASRPPSRRGPSSGKHPNIRTSEHHIPSRPRLSVRMFGSLLSLGRARFWSDRA